MRFFDFGRKNKEKLKKIESKAETTKNAESSQGNSTKTEPANNTNKNTTENSRPNLKPQTYDGCIVISVDELNNILSRGRYVTANIGNTQVYSKDWYCNNLTLVNNKASIEYNGKTIKFDTHKAAYVLFETDGTSYIVFRDTSTTNGNDSAIKRDKRGNVYIGSNTVIGNIGSGNNYGNSYNQKNSGSSKNTFDIRGVSSVAISTSSSDVNIRNTSSKECTITADNSVNAQVNGNQLVIKCNSDTKIMIPQDSKKLSFIINSSSGEVNMSRIICSDLKISSSSGDVALDVKAANITINTSSGDVSASHEYNDNGSVIIQTSSGDINYTYKNVNHINYNIRGPWDGDEVESDNGQYNANVSLASSSGTIEIYPC